MNQTFQENYDLQSKNSLAVPSKCRWFLSVSERSQLASAVAFARDNALPLFVLGAGTNVILGEFLDALVVEIAIPGRRFVSSRAGVAQVEVGAGEDWHGFVSWTLEQGWYGLENLALIPGTCGAAPIQNIGAYGAELSDFLDSVEIYDAAEQQFKHLSAAQCELAYRDSIFKNELLNRAIVLSMRLNLSSRFEPNLSYPALANHMETECLQPTPTNVFDSVVAIRRAKLPDPKDVPNSGSFFKNPIVDRAQANSLLSQFPGMPSYALPDDRTKIPAAWLIDTAGFKGWTAGGVGVHDQQALVLVNPGKKTSSEVLRLAKKIQAKIQSKFDIGLQFEPRIFE